MFQPRLVLLLFTMVGMSCSKGVVLKNQGSPDARGSSASSDGSGIISLPPDARFRDGQQGPEDVTCSRSVNLRGISITRPVPFDVVIVADNTDSLSWSRDSLSSGLRDLLSRVHGHEARFFVLTTTQYGSNSQAAVSPLTGKDIVSWRDSVSHASYLNDVTTYLQECTDSKGAPRTCPKSPPSPSEGWRVKGTWRFNMPAPVAAITPEMDDAAIASEQKRIADAILGLGGGGSPQEQPICTLLRYIGQAPSALPKHAVFVVLTDEDDTSPPGVCLAKYDAYQQINTFDGLTLCDSNCTEYYYAATKPNQELSLSYTCMPIDDKGTTHPDQATQKTLVLETVSRCAGDAGASTTLACNDAELAKATGDCGAGNLIQNCKHNCVVGRNILQCDLRRPDNKTDICTQPFEEKGVRYANLADYCSRSGDVGWKTCEVHGLKPSSADAGTYTSSDEYTTPLVTAKSTTEMIQSFKASADKSIGRSNYSIETIVLDPAFSCPVRSGQSYATNLRTLASSSKDVFPLCEDYAPAVARIADFADYLIQTSFPLDLDDYEVVDSVVVTNKQGQKRTVEASGYKYDDQAKQLIFGSGVLTAQDDTLAVNVAHECHRIIR